MHPTVHKTPQQCVKSLVLADDDPDDHYFFRGALEETAPDLALTIVEDGKTLLDLLKHYLPDIVFLDLDMPFKNGLQCLTEIRAEPATRELAVVIFSSTSRAANIDTAYEMGADLFFVKPASFQELRQAIQRLLSLNWQKPASVKQQFFVDGKYSAFI